MYDAMQWQLYITSGRKFHFTVRTMVWRATEKRRGTWRKTVYDEKQAVFLAQPFASGWPDCFSVSVKHWFEDKLICLEFIKFAYPSSYPWKRSIDQFYVYAYVRTYIHRISTKSRSRANIVTACLQYPWNIDQIISKRVSISMIAMNFAARLEITFYLLFDLLYNVLLWTLEMGDVISFRQKIETHTFSEWRRFENVCIRFIHSHYQDLFYVWTVCWQSVIRFVLIFILLAFAAIATHHV